jgi:hypothetical protein
MNAGGRPRRSWRTPRPRQVPEPAAAYQFTIRELLDDRLPAPRFDDPSRPTWRELRRDLFAATTGTAYDPRQFLELRGNDERAAWRHARRWFLEAQFAGDPRVRPEDEVIR